MAANNLPNGMTIHKMFGFPFDAAQEKIDFLVGTSHVNLSKLRSRFDTNTLCLLIIDEISFVGSNFFGRLEQRLREIMAEKDLPFGGLAVLLLGDFFQLPPVAATSLYSSVIQQQVYKRKLDGERIANGPNSQGAMWFSTFKKMELTVQMRAADDPIHMKFLNMLRSSSPDMALIAKQLPILYKTLTPDDAIENPEFCFTTIIINSNNERRSINNHQSKLYVLKHNSRRFVWNQPFDAATAALFQNFTYNELNQHFPQFSSYFVAGAPAFLIDNISFSRQLSNGTPVTLHSIILDPREDRDHLLDRLINSTESDDILLEFPPLYINVSVDNANPDAFVGMTMVEGEVVIPIEFSGKKIEQKIFLPNKARPTEVRSRQFSVDLRFACTVHKIQGQTCERIILDLNPRPFQPPVTLRGMYTGCSRVKVGKNIRLMPLQPGLKDYSHLITLRHDPELIAWLNAFDERTGFWDVNLCSLQSSTSSVPEGS